MQYLTFNKAPTSLSCLDPQLSWTHHPRMLVHMQDSTRYDKTQKLLEKYDPDYEVPTPRKLPPAPLPRQVTPGPMTPLAHQVRE